MNWDIWGPIGLLAVVLLFAHSFVAQKPFGLDKDTSELVKLARSIFGIRSPGGLDEDTSVQWVQFGLAGIAVAVLGWGYQLAKEGRPRERLVLRDRLLLVIGLSSFLGYFNFGHLHFGNFVHVWDTYHYVMGSKYFPELSYDKLYECAAVVDLESGRKDELLRRTLTDLRNNLIIRPDEIIAHPERCKESFSPARWESFKKDINTFHGFVNEGRWKEIHQDHGYNATPVWTLAGMALTNTGPVSMEQLKRLNLLDPLYLALTLAMVWWAFGPRAFAVAALTLGTNFANRYYWTGGAFLRHDWVFYLVASICLLKKDRPFLGGMAFAYATLLRLFPGLAALGPIIAAVEYYRTHGSFDRRFARWVAGGAVGTVLLVGASFATLGGVTTWERFAQNTLKHSNTPLTNHMGLRTLLSWRPNTVGQRMVDNTQIDSWAKWKATRLANWREAQPVFWGLMALAVWLVWMALKASGAEPSFALALGVGFIVFGAELTNYYYCFLMGIAVLHAQRREVGIILGALAMLTLFINWGPLSWMSHWLDEQYVAMSLASIFSVVGIWWLFTKWGQEAAFAPDPPPALAGGPAIGRALTGEPKARKKKGRKRR